MDYKQELITTIHDFGCNLDFLAEKLVELSEDWIRLTDTGMTLT